MTTTDGDWTDKPGRYLMGDFRTPSYAEEQLAEAEFQAARERTPEEDKAIGERELMEALERAYVLWPTKDSGVRDEYPSGMVRDTQRGKARFDLLFAKGVPYERQMMTRFAALLARGAEKYDERNWEKANSSYELERAESSAMRHLIQWFCGETDEDHAAAVFFNILEAETIRYKMSVAE